MTQKFAVLPLLFALILAACGTESSLPSATGKGSIRAINAIPSSPEVGFLIEERTIGTADYRQTTTLAEYDDLSYKFNFEVFFAGDSALTRFASRSLDVVADMDYIMVLTGTLTNPTVILWESPQRDFVDTETVFQARFAHTAESLGTVDYYFAPPGTPPVLGEAAGTLAFGEILTAADFAAGDYVLTVTANDDPSDVLFQSNTSTFLAAADYTISTFDGGSSTFAPIVARAYPAGSGTLFLADARFPATVEFINASLQLGTIDIYNDETQTSRIVDDLPHRGISAELNLAAGDTDISVTPFDATTPIYFSQNLNFFAGTRGRVVAVGATDNFGGFVYIPDRRGVSTQVKFQVFAATENFDFVSVYAIEADAVLDQQLPVLAALPSSTLSTPVVFATGSFDLYVREFQGTEILAGPIRIDVALGDVVNAIIYDNVDPAIVDFEILPNNP